ncbi:hypothetical protein GGF44_001378 [Coemansia sp. RSA 1694]|nr:hypothetical protein GGF38_000736 [Coemansia sp. RSA 25]KAJ2444608.1 hypothetical protein GGF42_006255 [Coemansia sp. RSA 2424]KAJ2643012.1 hypothetical protein GGF44_001378 [Coemansia sp. RSA 1694]
MMFDNIPDFGIDLSALFSQELGEMALAPTPVAVASPPPNVLVNRVPDGFTPILINLQRCSRAELRRFLHNMLCKTSASEEEPNKKERPLGRCGCELLEFDYQPDFLFNKRKQPDNSDDGQLDDSDDDCTTTTSVGDSPAIDDDEAECNDDDSESTADMQREYEAERNRIKIKRPPNSFMIYRSERHIELVKEYRGGNKVISGIIAKEWHSMGAETKKRYEDKAAAKKREHEMLYPNYKFMPKRRKF